MLTDGRSQQGKTTTYKDVASAVGGQIDRILHMVRSSMDVSGEQDNTPYTLEQKNELAKEFELLSCAWAAYEKHLEHKFNATVVDVTTVVELDDHLREVIINKLEADLGGNVVLQEHIDPSLIGGIVMSLNDKRIDASVRSQLECAREALRPTKDGGEC